MTATISHNETLSAGTLPEKIDITVNPYTEFDNSRIETLELTSVNRQLAQTAFSGILGNLQHSPNNPGYRNSVAFTRPRNWLHRREDSLLGQLEKDFSNLSTNIAEHDINQMLAFHYDTTKSRSDTMFGSYYFAYLGIKNITEELAKARQAEKPSPAKVNYLTSRAISATAVRAHYLSSLSAANQEFRTAFGETPFRQMFSQNILSAIRYAAQLDSPR